MFAVDLCAEETRSLVAGSSSRSGAASQESSRAESAEMAAGWQPGTVERGVPSVCPPGWRRGARGRRPRAETRCWVWCRDTTAREAAIRSCSEDSRSAGTWRHTLELSMNLREVSQWPLQPSFC